jgi:hypothetical protein
MFKNYFFSSMSWLTLILTPFCFAQDCCLPFGGICGDQCCDGTFLPKNCGDFQFLHLPPAAAPNAIPSKTENIKSETQGSLKPPPKWLYVWHDPMTKTPYISASFPPWYRNPHYPDNYPRVWVYDEHHRLLDDTGLQVSAEVEEKKRQQAEVHLQQQVAYQEAERKQAEIATKQARLDKLLQTWIKTGVVTGEMEQLLDELATAGKVTMAMTEEQVQIAWGKFQSQKSVLNENKMEKVLKYKKGEVILVENRVRSVASMANGKF